MFGFSQIVENCVLKNNVRSEGSDDVFGGETSESAVDVHTVQQCMAMEEMWEEVEYCNLYIDEYIWGNWKLSIINSHSSYIVDV